MARQLLAGLIDYAGLYPPAALAMPEVVRHYARHRDGAVGWMLGRFVCSAAALDRCSAELAPYLSHPDDGAPSGTPWRISVTGTGDVAADLTAIATFNARHRRDDEAGGALADTYEAKVATVDEVRRLAAATPDGLTTYLELPLAGPLEPLVAALARTGARAKMRTGGTTRDAFPAASAIVTFLRLCLAYDIPAKATAGLHHPLAGSYRLTYAGDAPVGPMFGFLTVLLASAHVAAGGSEAEAVALLGETETGALALHEDHIAWQGPAGSVRFDRAAIRQLRDRRLVSIGSCSVSEPVDDLRAMGWL